MPWKGEKDPYLIWLSEIILQQTRVQQGLPYFEKFKKAFPTVHHLAKASEDQVMKLWQGLGYYNRARNMHFTARYISKELGGVFPSDYSSILQLKGVGTYTASAIASFAFDLPHAVVDGNVYRVLSRVFLMDVPIDEPSGKKKFVALAHTLLPKDQPGIYNQAIMDFGATVCTPKIPACSSCPLKRYCKALHKNKVADLPRKGKKRLRKKRYFHFFIVKDKTENTFIHQRDGNDIWRKLFTFPLIEMKEESSLRQLKKSPLLRKWLPEHPLTFRQSGKFKQLLTHQEIRATFWEVPVRSCSDLPMRKIFMQVKWETLSDYAFPKLHEKYLYPKIK